MSLDKIETWLEMAEARLATARHLLDRPSGPYVDVIYLGGYGPECAVKALILHMIPEKSRLEFISAAFKSVSAHRVEELWALFKFLFRAWYLATNLTEEQLRNFTATLSLHAAAKRPIKEAFDDNNLNALLAEKQWSDLADLERSLGVPETNQENYRDIVTWSTTLRYSSEEKTREDAASFVASCEAILAWAKRNLQWLQEHAIPTKSS
jgi:HEPN domain-containing protein